MSRKKTTAKKSVKKTAAKPKVRITGTSPRPQAKRYRPIDPRDADTINWKPLLPVLRQMREQGQRLRALVEYVEEATGIRVSSDSVQRRIDPAVTDPDLLAAIGDLIAREPWTTWRDITTAFNVPTHVARPAIRQARKHQGGYYIVETGPQKGPKYSDADLVAVLHRCQRDLGLTPDEGLSTGLYDDWRAGLPAKQRANTPTKQLLIRRHDGKWNLALAAAGITGHHYRPQDTYQSLSTQDRVSHLAYWLRVLRHAPAPMVEATEAGYAHWQGTDGTWALSVEGLTMHRNWTQMLREAATRESTAWQQGTPITVTGVGEGKNPPALT